MVSLGFEGQKMSLRKVPQEISSAETIMGKNMIVSDNSHWSKEEIVQTFIDISQQEGAGAHQAMS